MNNDWTIKKLFEEICRIEIEYKLFEKKVNGVYFWKLIRFSLFRELSQKLNLYGEAHPNIKNSKHRNSLLKVLKRFIYGTFNSPLLGSQKVDILLFPHTRKENINSQKVDIYTAHLEKEYNVSNLPYMVLERAYMGEYSRSASSIIRHDDPFNAFTILEYLKPQKKRYDEVEKLLEGIGTIANIPIHKINALSSSNISNRIVSFNRKYNYYKKILKKHSPKQVIVVVSYGMEALISASRDLQIEVVEVQHGTIVAHHVGYSFPENVYVPYFPDKVNMWGKYWYDNSRLPIAECKVSYGGFPYLNKEITKYKNIERNELRVLFISQGTIAEKLSKIAIEFAIKNTKRQVVYRLHPSEAAVWKTLYPELYRASMENENFIIETQIDAPLYQSFACSNTVVGVNSTALIESIAAGCQLILVDLPGVEYFDYLINKGLVKKVACAKELQNIIDEKSFLTIDIDYFFHKD